MTASSTDRSAVGVALSPRWIAEHPLSRTQRLIWTGQRLAPDEPVANMGMMHRIRGRIDPERFIRAVDDVVRESEALRTVVAETPGREPVARILASPPRVTEVVDLPADALETWRDERVARPIDATSCAFDSVLMRHADDDWTWWLDLHHVVTDAWSSALVYERVARRYAGEDIDPLPSLYAHVAASTADPADEQRLEREARWASIGGPSRAIAPYGPRGRRTSAVTRCDVSLPDDIDAALAGRYRSISRELSLLTLMATTTAVLLSRLDGTPTVTIGVPIHHRAGPAARRVIGPLMELYPMVMSVDPGATFADTFDLAHRTLLGVLRSAKPGESPERGFDAIVNVLTARYGRFGDLPATTEWARSGHVDPAHPIRVQVYDHGDGLRLEVDLNAGLSVDGAHLRFPDHLARTLEAAIAEPTAAVRDHDILTDDERAILDALNPPHPGGDEPRPVHEQVADALAADPDAVTAESPTGRITAGELDRAAGALSCWLTERGVGAGDRIGLRMHRSLDVLVAIHGVLRAGAAFVMLDPDDPAERHDAIVTDASIGLVLDGVPPLDRHAGTPHPIVRVGLDDVAYVLYTSGSTGTPKGVPITHRGLADYLRFAADTYVTERPMVMALHSSLVFDLTITSLFLPQLTGGRTIVITGDAVSTLAEVATRRDLNVLKATPSQLELLARMIDEPMPLEVVVVGGEAFRRPIAARFAERLAPGARVYNEYGPTEAVVGCMIHPWDPAVDHGADVPIGRACPGAEVYVLDPNGRPSAVGSWGELYVRRPGMATGYLGLPELTAERFAAMPAIDDVPLYRTGDRVRVERDVVVFGGRLDDQLQLGGVRLEPGEIETALLSHADITNAVVRVWTPGSTRITRCERCGLGTDVPGVTVEDGTCSTCRAFDAIEPQTRAWFRTPDDLDAIRVETRDAAADFDCLLLLSGGKDSTYALYQLVERGWRVHALTLDNGYISDGAKANIERSVTDLGVSHEFVTTDAMPDIFRDSLERFSNVCNGCYKTIYTLATARAAELGIPVVVTGLSRGQMFETRLIPHQFEADRFDPDAIDATVLEARRAYHRTPDAVTERLPEQRVFDDDVLDRIRYVDFYRYVDVGLGEMYEFLERRAPWVRPADTGRSTNCLVNVAGIHVHRTERGYHNYAEPYSWDVRLGHKTRSEALDELDDDIDLTEVDRMLDEIGYRPRPASILTAWYETADGRPIDATLIRAQLRSRLPERAVPQAFVHVDEVPLADSAKLDVAALPPPSHRHTGSAAYVAPATRTEVAAADVWARVLGVDRVGRDDDFFDLGGASLPALEVISALESVLDVELPDALGFQHRTLREFAAAVDRVLGGATQHRVPIPPVDGAPLSPCEEAMLFEYRAAPGDPKYNVQRLFTVPATAGPIDPARLRAACELVVSRHGPLHTAVDADRTVLDVGRALEFGDMSGMSPDSFAASRAGVPFDLDHGPLVRVHLGSWADGSHAVLVAMHHMSVSAGTFDVLWSEIDAAYHRRAVPELTTTVAAHGAWQRSRSAAGIAFWESELARRTDPAADITLPVPSAPEPSGYLTRDATVTLPELAAAATTTPFATALSAIGVVLAAHARTDLIEVGITASTKDHPATEPLVGCFLTTIPLQLDVTAGSALREVDRRVGDEISRTLPHRAIPFATIVRRARALGLPTPDIRHIVSYERHAPARWGAHEVGYRTLGTGSSVADTTFFVREMGERLELALEYRGDVVSAVTAERLLRQVDEILTTCCRRPGLTAADARADQLADDLVGPPLPDPSGTVLDEIVERASLHPDRPAVIEAAGAVRTYRELLQRAGAIGEVIRTSAPHARRVGVAVGRSASMVEAIVGTWCAGAAYVPLDPSTPQGRTDVIIAQAGIDAVVVDAATRSRFPDLIAIDVSGIDALGVATVAATAVPQRPEPTDEAYVIFTSGSTGTPAGVAVTHANLAASNAARPAFYDAPPERFLLTSSIGFDSSVVGLVWPLTAGGSIVLPDDDAVHDVDRLGDLIAERSVTHSLMVPSLYAAVLARRSHRLATLRTAIVAGETCPASLVARHHALLPHVDLVNEYGPTETTVWASAHRCLPSDDPVPIGGPIAGVTLRVADDDHRPVAHGAVGELLVSGPGTTRGYLDGRRTDAFVEADGMRWYRTGDLVRCDDERRLVFIGRIDDQLNVGGVRVEPVEIERLLRDVAGVRDAVVVAADVRGRELLVAHVEGAARVDPAAVRRRLADLLPASVLPGVIAVHADLPRSVHGKIDRAAAAQLPILDPGHHHRGDDTGPIDDDIDGAGSLGLARVVDAWRRALRRSDLDADADFFAAGGDSLAAVELVTSLGRLVGRDIAVAELLRAPTPAAMASWLDVDASAPADTGVVRVTMRHGRPDGPLVIVTPAWDDVHGYRALADALPSDVSVVALAVVDTSGALDHVDPVVDAGRELVRDDLVGRERIAVVGWSIGGLVAFDLGHRLAADGAPVGFVGLVDTFFPGEQRHLWSNRWWKYKSMLRPGSFRAAAREFAGMARGRLRRMAASAGRRLLALAGEAVDVPAERTTPGGLPFAAMDHTPNPGSAHTVLWAVDTTNPERNRIPWRRVAPDLEIVEVRGRHRGLHSIMAADRVEQITNDIERRLRRR